MFPSPAQCSQDPGESTFDPGSLLLSISISIDILNIILFVSDIRMDICCFLSLCYVIDALASSQRLESYQGFSTFLQNHLKSFSLKKKAFSTIYYIWVLHLVKRL